MHRVEKRRDFQCQTSLLHINYHRVLQSYTGAHNLSEDFVTP
jgi:hypothetical protein